jgi:hypothetical protein
MGDHLPQCWTQDMGGMKRASADSCAVCNAIKFAVADALHEYDKQTYERCAKHMRTARREALDAAREAVAAVEDQWDAEIDYDRDYAFDPSGGTRNPRIWLRDALAAIDALRQEKK